MANKLTIEEVKKVAMKHYNNGGDTIIECWEDREIQEWIDGAGVWYKPGSKKELLKMFGLYEDYRKDIQNIAW